jgi:hypothetical protein
MANYTVITNFGAKDSLPSGNAGKLIKGTEFTTEFNNIATAVATKADTTTVNLKANTADVLPLTGGTLSGPLTLRPLASVHPVLSLVSSDIDILDNDVIGSITFGGIDSNANPPTTASIKGEATGTWTSTGFGTDLVFSVSANSVGGGTNTERMRITAYDGTRITTPAGNQKALEFYNGTVIAAKLQTAQSNGDGYFNIGNKLAGLQFVSYQNSKYIAPYNVDFNTNNIDSDRLIDLGNLSARFDDIYATNGTIQTSDQNEKQDIAELSEAETRVAVACKGLLRKFRWKSAVEDKGDEARTHFGIIAQDLQAAFEAEGLDAGDYAMFISSTWTNDDGEEQTRLGVRYSELLAFIIGGI